MENNNLANQLVNIKAKDIMSRFAITIKEEASLVNAAHLMMRFKISGLPVMSKEDLVAGIITATDLFREMGNFTSQISQSDVKSRLLVKDVMTRNVFSATKETTFLDIINMMFNNNIHTVPIIENNRLIGIIGRRDVINTYYNLFRDEIDNI